MFIVVVKKTVIWALDVKKIHKESSLFVVFFLLAKLTKKEKFTRFLKSSTNSFFSSIHFVYGSLDVVSNGTQC